MLRFPNAKINLGLFITEKRTDGYHNLETIFYPIHACKDVLEIVPAPQFGYSFLGKSIDTSATNNLIITAYNLIARAFPHISASPIHIHMYKNIPMGAGLGGGSSDAAHMLRILNDYYTLALSNDQLAAFALQLGSDCPFFIYNTPQLGKGRGEILHPIQLDLSAFDILLIYPSVHISTATAFQGITPATPSINLENLSVDDIHDWKDYLHNDFEANIFQAHPALASIKEQLYLQGAIYASLSGTGSTVYGIFPKGSKVDIKLDIPYETFLETSD